MTMIPLKESSNRTQKMVHPESYADVSDIFQLSTLNVDYLQLLFGYNSTHALIGCFLLGVYSVGGD